MRVISINYRLNDFFFTIIFWIFSRSGMLILLKQQLKKNKN
ncbi:Uncharacterised protein [Proteus penneri]|nr:Uncharacterised protein [Proteus penneri]